MLMIAARVGAGQHLGPFVHNWLSAPGKNLNLVERVGLCFESRILLNLCNESLSTAMVFFFSTGYEMIF